MRLLLLSALALTADAGYKLPREVLSKVQRGTLADACWGKHSMTFFYQAIQQSLER